MNGNIVIRNQEELRAFALDKNTVSIGSGPAAALVIDAPGIEPVHALITWEPRASAWLLSAASPGTECAMLLNGRACPADATLEDGDLIGLPGGIIMRFSAAPSLPSFGGKETNEISLRSISKLIIGRTSGEAWTDSGKVLLDPEDARISRIHLELEQTAPGVFYAADKSTTGTLLNGRRFDRRLLIAGDRLRLGGYGFEFTGNALHLIPGHGGARVEARNVSMQSREGRDILNDISLEIAPGSFVGIFSGSNQDRNTLLNALSGAKEITGGEVRINGVRMGDPRTMTRAGMGRVPLEDIVHPELTVSGAITSGARLKLPRGTPRASILQLVEETIGHLGLSELKNERISRLTNDKRKRVSIAVEMLARPEILFLDEPLCGLDQESESEMMILLRQLTGSDCTVVCATHAPERAYLFDQICCLQDSRLIFNGTPDEAKIRFGIEQDLDEIFLKPGADRPQEFVHPSGEASPPASFTPAEETITTPGPQKRGAGHLSQLGILLQRQWNIFMSSPRHLLFFLAQPLIIGLLIGGLPDHTARRILFCVIATFWFGCSNGARQIVCELHVLRSERASGLRLNSYLLSKYIFLAFITTLQALLLVFTIHATSAMTDSPAILATGPGPWPTVLAGAALAGVATGLAISASVRTEALAVVWKLLVLIPLFAFGGFAFSHPELHTSLPAPVLPAVLGGFIIVCYGGTLLRLNGRLRDK